MQRKKTPKIAVVLLDCAEVQGTWVQVRVQFKANETGRTGGMRRGGRGGLM